MEYLLLKCGILRWGMHDITYVTPQHQMSNKSGFEILRESTSKSDMMILGIFRFVHKRNVRHLI